MGLNETDPKRARIMDEFLSRAGFCEEQREDEGGTGVARVCSMAKDSFV
jgi:hypothetical protein